ncbi:MAG: DUF1553 domain-containing protein [Planctomycetaceae bacterium]
MLSAVYQQSSQHSALSTSNSPDPENRLLSRFPRRRLGFEAMRDSMLAVSGRLDRKQYGRPVDLLKEPSPPRRTIYGFVDRNNLPGLYRIFDFANPDASTGQRPTTTVPQQALFGMNSPFVIAQAEALAAHPDVASQPTDEQRIAALSHRALGREPEAEETALALRYLQSAAPNDTLSPLERYAQVLLLSNEFWFVD